MATARNISTGICDETFSELTAVKDRIVALREHLGRDYRREEKVLGIYERHLNELINQIDWKLQIMSHSCAFDWKGSAEYEENVVSVGPAEKTTEDFSPGYLGG
jgi:hypothetical protein